MSIKKILCLALMTSLLPINAFANFSDTKNHQYNQAITALAKDGCISGYTDGTYKPENKITRAETLKLILTCLNIPKIYTEESFTAPAGSSYFVNGKEIQLEVDSEIKIKVPFNPDTYPDLEFRDLTNTEWYVGILKEALVREIITGYADNTIKASRTVAKGEFFAMLYRVVPKELQKADTTKDVAKDSLVGQWYNEPFAFFKENNLLGLDDQGNINPFRELNRGQVAHFIYTYKQWLTNRINGTVSSTTTPEATTSQETATTEPSPAPTTPPATTTIASEGKASFMGKGIAGNRTRTASGDIYDPEARTAAHPTIPFGTLVKVVNQANQKFVCVRINDRGPNQQIHPDRIIDLSYRAFEEIADISQGIINVSTSVIESGNCTE